MPQYKLSGPRLYKWIDTKLLYKTGYITKEQMYNERVLLNVQQAKYLDRKEEVLIGKELIAKAKKVARKNFADLKAKLENKLAKREEAKLAKKNAKKKWGFVRNYNPAFKTYVYFFNKFGKINSMDEDDITDMVLSARDDFRKMFKIGGHIHIKFYGEKLKEGAGYEQSKGWKFIDVADVESFLSDTMEFGNIRTGINGDDDYMFYIYAIRITITPPAQGGCRDREKTYKLDDCQLIDHQSRGKNNCFFSIFKDKFIESYGISRVSEKFFNGIRAKYDLEADSLITAEDAIRIFTSEFGLGLMVLNEFYKPISYKVVDECTRYEIANILLLKDEHYLEYLGKVHKVNTCEKCGTDYYTKHDAKACSSRFTFIKTKMTHDDDTQWVALKNIVEKENTYKNVLHYDIESHHITTVNNRHEAYLVGYCYYDDKEELIYGTFSGTDCMKKFYDFLGSDDVAHIKYINAFNGSKFDHLFLVAESWKDNVKPDMLNNGGRILKATIKQKQVVDINCHLIGSLRDNLKSTGCAVQKGDIDHSKTDDWDKMTVDLQTEVQSYLEKDVLGLCELYEKVNQDMFDNEGVNLTSYLTTSHCAYKLWSGKYLDKEIYIPTIKDDIFMRKSIYGGRCYKNKHRFESKYYSGIKNGSVKYEDIDDYIQYLDIVSLYPTAMKEQYPVGKPIHTTSHMSGKMGIYDISYVCPKQLLTPVLPRRSEKGLIWDLTDGDGTYTSVDIENAKRFGYEIIVHKGIYWIESSPVFSKYIDKFYQKKKNAVKDTAGYALAKLYLNGLYGKMIQRPIFSKTIYVSNHSELLSALCEYIVDEIDQVGDRLVLSGIPRNEIDMRKCVSKPTHLGSFVLSYSRWIMMDKIKESNPDNEMNRLFFYSDTDSLMVHCSSPMKMGKELGDLSNDLGAGAKVIRAIFISPKLYMLEYVNKDMIVKVKFAGKGMNCEDLSIAKFVDMDIGNSMVSVAKFQMKRILLKRNRTQKDLPILSVYHTSNTDMKNGKLILEKTINMKMWGGRDFVGNDSWPVGFVHLITDTG